MARIEQVIRTMLIEGAKLATAGVPDERVTQGYRLQDSIIPAVTYSVDQTEPASTNSAIYMSNITVKSIASTSLSALTISDTVKAKLVEGEFDSVYIGSVAITGQSIEPETVGVGDEQEPAVATVTAQIHWS